VADRTTTYGVIAPHRARSYCCVNDRAAAGLGRLWLRWTVYRQIAQWTPDGDYITGHERLSHHWTRRAAWRESSRLRFAEHTEEASRG
jgi:hypothetical protein